MKQLCHSYSSGGKYLKSSELLNRQSFPSICVAENQTYYGSWWSLLELYRRWMIHVWRTSLLSYHGRTLWWNSVYRPNLALIGVLFNPHHVKNNREGSPQIIHSCIQQIFAEYLHTSQAQDQMLRSAHEKRRASCSYEFYSQEKKTGNPTSSKRKYGKCYDKVKGTAVCIK